MIRRPPRSTPLYSSAASDVYKRQAGRSPGRGGCDRRPGWAAPPEGARGCVRPACGRSRRAADGARRLTGIVVVALGIAFLIADRALAGFGVLSVLRQRE